MLLKAIIINCSSQIKEDRTISSVYHLLKGKRSIQTVQDAHLYGLERFYGIYKKLNKSHFDKIINELVYDQFLTPLSQSTTIYKPTKRGIEWLDTSMSDAQLTCLNGIKYHAIDQLFLDRLLLLVQVLTNSKMHHSSYIPVIDKINTTNWVKSVYQKMRSNVNEQLQAIYDELSILLHIFPEYQSSMFVDRLTGFKDYGMSINQLADHYEMDVHDVRIQLVGMTHAMFDMIHNENDRFPIMSLLINDLPNNDLLTLSANKTYDFIKNDYSTEDIAQIRQLKINTIYDHIVEIALYDPAFQIDSYVSIKKQQEIMNAVKQTKSSKLKHIKENVNVKISYFQIRLTLVARNNLLKLGDINDATN